MTSVHDRQYTEWLAQVRKLGRAPDEWIGSNPDTKIPGRIADRVLRTWGFVCYLSGVQIRPGDSVEMEHVIPLSMGGMHAERNLRPALKKEHRRKTSKEATERARGDNARRLAFGLKNAPARKIQSAGFPRSAKSRTPVSEKFANLPKSRLYQESK